MDQSQLAEYIGNRSGLSVLKDVLVKPLDPIMIERIIEIPVPKDTTVDEEGVEATDFEETTTETRQFESVFAKGIVLMTPPEQKDQPWAFKAGDTVIYNKKFSVEFDVLKDSRLVKPYDIIAIETEKN